MNNIIPVAGTPGLVNIEGEYIALKPLCEALGVDAWTQMDKLKNKSWAVTRLIPATGSDGKTYQMFSIHRKNVAMWLANIDERRVKEEVRPILIAYQKEANDALDSYFNKGFAVRDVKEKIEQLEQGMHQLSKGLEQARQRNTELEAAIETVLPTSKGIAFQDLVSALIPQFPEVTTLGLANLLRIEGLMWLRNQNATNKAIKEGYAFVHIEETTTTTLKRQTLWTARALEHITGILTQPNNPLKTEKEQSPTYGIQLTLDI